jgi:hypothetical protein
MDIIAINSTTSQMRRLHPLAIRVMHWTNAAAMIVLIGSGWGIYNDSVIFHGLHFPVKIGSWAAESLLWHSTAPPTSPTASRPGACASACCRSASERSSRRYARRLGSISPTKT